MPKGLEWETASPPPTENFKRIPIVTEDAYAYPLVEPREGNAPEDNLISSETRGDPAERQAVKDKLS